jgi:multidrug resistance efflux pump
MVAITATSYSTPSLQAAQGRAKLAQAQNEATQAEENAKRLRGQANEAELQAAQSQSNVNQLAASYRRQTNSSTTNTYSSPAASSARATGAPTAQVQNLVENLYRASSQKRAQSGNALKTREDAPPVINSQGQTTGRVLNLSA